MNQFEMKSFFLQASLDATGFWASAICAAHCVAVPILLSFAAFSSLAFLENPAVEYTILAVSCVVGVSSLLPSYFRHHRKVAALYILVTGFLFIVISRFAPELFEAILTPIGALLIALAHLVNYNLCKKYHKVS